MKLEVDKTYKDREGNVVTIVSKDSYHSTSIYPYLGNNASSYMEDGRFREYDLYHDYDLIEEVPAIGMFGSTWAFNNLKEEQTMKLEVGKVYKSRDGSIVTITDSRGADSYPYAGSNGLIYTATGAYSISTPEHQWDLIEEVSSDASKLEIAIGKSYKTRQQEEKPMQAQVTTLKCTLVISNADGELTLQTYPADEGWRESNVVTVLDTQFEVVLSKSQIEELYTKRLADRVQKADEVYKDAIEALETANDFFKNL